MARLQILELPEGSSDDRPPYVLVVDQMPKDDAAFEALRCDLGFATAQQVGARAVLVFEETIDIPANEVSLDPDGYPIKLRIEPDFETFRQQVQDEIQYAQGKVTHALRATDQERKNALTDALGMDRLRDWDDIRNAAAGIRKQRDEQAEAIERVRQLHQSVDYRGAVICRECSAYAGGSADNAPVAHDKCVTLQALTGRQPTMICDITVDNAAEAVASHDPSRRA